MILKSCTLYSSPPPFKIYIKVQHQYCLLCLIGLTVLWPGLWKVTDDIHPVPPPRPLPCGVQSVKHFTFLILSQLFFFLLFLGHLHHCRFLFSDLLNKKRNSIHCSYLYKLLTFYWSRHTNLTDWLRFWLLSNKVIIILLDPLKQCVGHCTAQQVRNLAINLSINTHINY